jgi:hypothetical protein
MSEHDFEPVRGLPGDLPRGETLLWQGAPDWWKLAQRAFHMRSVAIYFAVLIVWRGAATAAGGATLIQAVEAALWLTPVAGIVLGLLVGLALMTSRTSVYTITSKRVVLRFGVALPKAINIPYTIIENAALKGFDDGSGDIALRLTQPNKIAYLLLWPHARPWKMARPEPSLRAIANAAEVANLLSEALKAAHGGRSAPVNAAAPAADTMPAGALSPV